MLEPVWNFEALVSSITFEFDPDLRCEDPIVEHAVEIWKNLRRDRDMPSRSDIDPVTLPRDLLPHILLIDVLHEQGQRFRWRLIGTGITRILRRDSTGYYWDELYDEQEFAAIGGAVQWVVEHRRPLRSVGRVPLPERSHLMSENLNLPLSTNGREVDMIFGVSVYR